MRFIYINDIEYLWKKRKIMLLFLWIVPVLVLFLNINSSKNYIEIVNLSNGTDLDIQNSNLISIIMYVFNISVGLFLVIDLYVKDVSYQLDNIFLRMKPSNWVIKKSVVFIFMMLFVKLIQYMLITLVVIFYHSVDMQIIELFFKDFLYMIFLQYLFLILYFYGILYKVRYIFYLLFVICLLIIPKSIFALGNIECLIFVTLLFLFLISIIIIFNRKSKKIMEFI